MSSPRPSFHQIYMKLACELSKRSTCRRLKVGTVISSTDFRKILAVGYNGNASGLSNGCDTDIPGKCGCLHSEDNAVINCDAPRNTEKIVFVTHLPCVMCAKRLINLGNVLEIYYLHSYRSLDSLPMLRQTGIVVQQFQEPFFSRAKTETMSDDVQYDIQGQLTSKDQVTPLQESTDVYNAEQYASAGQGHNLIPATSPGLTEPHIPGTLTTEPIGYQGDIPKDPWRSATDANAEALQRMGIATRSPDFFKGLYGDV